MIKGKRVAFLPLKLLPARTWNNTPQGEQPAACERGSDEHLEACIRVCEDALRIKLGGTGSGKAHEGSTECHRLIVHNLFALEGFHIAEALGVPSVVVSACLPYPPPASFYTRFKAAYPQLWNALQHQGTSASHYGLNSFWSTAQSFTDVRCWCCLTLECQYCR